MSKKKNTLQDLNEFLKQQAATLVSPEKLGEKFPESAVVTNPTSDPVIPEPTVDTVSPNKLLLDLKTLANSDSLPLREKLYDVIIQVLESQSQTSPEDKMLINTALYLKHGENWKEKISAYWKNKSQQGR